MPDQRKTERFTIDRNGVIELTVVGKNGQEHRYPNYTGRKRIHGHFTHEGEYRRAYEAAVERNRPRQRRN